MMFPPEPVTVPELLLYGRLQDTLCYFGDNATISIMVNLYTDKKDGERLYYRREVQYYTKTQNLVRKVVRFMEPTLLIDIRKPVNGFKAGVVLNVSMFEMMRMILLPRLTDYLMNLNTIYVNKDGKLSMESSPYTNPIELELSENQRLWFKFTMDEFRYNDQYIPCVQVYLNNFDTYTTARVQDLYGLIHILRNLNLYTYAVNMLNSMNSNMLIGTNMYDMTQHQEINPVAQYVEAIQKEKRAKSSGFFNKEIAKRKDRNNE